MQIYTAAEQGLLEELEAVIDRRSGSRTLSLVGVAGVTDGLAVKCQIALEAAQQQAAANELGYSDDDADDGDGWKNGQQTPA